MSDKKTVLAIGMPIARAPQPETMDCLFAAMAELRREPYVSAHLFDPVGYQVDNARNLITLQAIQSIPDLTHIMWIDDDMTFEPDAIRRLINHDLPIVGGLCFNRRPPYPPVLVHFTEQGFAFEYDYPEGLIEVDATGAAFLLTKKEVYLRIREKHPGGPWSIIDVGEDVSFCKRAASVGIKTRVDTTVKIGHIGPINFDEKTTGRLREFRSNPYFKPHPMPKGDPVVSIIVPTWNQKPEWLKAAVASALAQTVPVEVIVVDDGSDVPVTMADLGWIGGVPGITDDRFRNVRIIRHETNRGCFPALNTGINAMTTEWFSWLSSDDLFYPPKIERQIEEMKRTGSLVSTHSYDLLTADRRVAKTVLTAHGWRTIEDQRRILSQGCAINGLTALIHRSVLDEVRLPDGNVFDTSFTIAADWELWNRIGTRHLWHVFIEILATRREYPGTMLNASQRYMADPEKRAIWQAENEEIHRRYMTAEDLRANQAACEADVAEFDPEADPEAKP